MLFSRKGRETADKPDVPMLSPEGRTLARLLCRVGNPMLDKATRIRAYEELTDGWVVGLGLDETARLGRDLYARCGIGETPRAIWWGIHAELSRHRASPQADSRLPRDYQWLEAAGWWSPQHGEALPPSRAFAMPSQDRLHALLHPAPSETEWMEF